MQVPPDLATRLSRLAHASGCSPEASLREAISRWIEGSAFPASTPVEQTRTMLGTFLESGHEIKQPAAPTLPCLGAAFVPQQVAISIYE